MARLDESDFEAGDSILDDEDDPTLAAIDQGIEAADDGRLVPEDEVRKLPPKWVSEFSALSRRQPFA